MTAQTFQGFLLTRNWRDVDGGVELEYWFATDQGPLQVQVQGERSVFFLAQSQLARARELLVTEPGVEISPVDLRDFHLEAVSGVYFASYRQARRVADRLAEQGLEPLEADINPADRFLMERFVSCAALLHGEPVQRDRCLKLVNPGIKSADYRPRLKVVSFDIETAMQGLQLFSISVEGRSGDERVRRVFMLGEGARQDFVEVCATQGDLLQAFLDWIVEFDPDVLIGWNVINFDTWYLQRVAQHLGRRLLLGRERRPAHWRELDDDGERRAVHLPGRVVLDGIDLLRAAFYNFESFSLENVARQLLGEGKLLQGGDRGVEIGRLFEEDKSRLAEYNLRDSELVSEIFAVTDLMDFALARAAMTGLNLDRMGGSVASFDNLYLPRLHRAGYVAPNANSEHIASPGGAVLDSQPGIYDHVLVLDFKSLYPSIIRTFLVDPLGLALGVSDTLSQDETVAGFLEARFSRDLHILPALIEQLWKQRDEARQSGDKALSQAIKIIMNSFYGVLGTPGCRFFDPRLATSITRRGHQILGRTRDYIEESGHRVIYGDTDSVFVWIQDAADEAAADAAGKALQRDLNSWWSKVIRDEFALESVLELEFETHFKRFLMPTVRGSEKGSKKRYAGVVSGPEGDQLVFKGLENVRTDWTKLAREFQQELYRRVFAGEPFEDYVRELTTEVLAGRRDSLLVYRKRLRRKLDEYQRNIPPHVQAARLYEARGLPAPSRGAWVEYVITSAGAEPAATPLAPLDYQHYVDRQLEPVADGILAFVGTSFAHLAGKQIDLF